ncbi:MAG: 30S ribosomal protein S8 [Patescibacteria group bacterium]
MTDPISDMLSRIRNAQAAGKTETLIPYSKIKHDLAQILAREGWISKIDVVEKLEEEKGKNKKQTIFKWLKVNLKYIDRKPAIGALKRLSSPGCRLYIAADKIYKVRNGFGILILSTPHGLLTGKEARKKGVGGELICEVW